MSLIIREAKKGAAGQRKGPRSKSLAAQVKGGNAQEGHAARILPYRAAQLWGENGINQVLNVHNVRSAYRINSLISHK